MNLLQTESATYRKQIDQKGFALFPEVLDARTVERLRTAIEQLGEREEVRRKVGIYGIRNLLDVMPEVRSLAASRELRALTEPILGADCFAARGTLFDKIPEANWKLGWHQDSVITVRERHEVDGFRLWSQKAGVWHVEPPIPVLENVLTLRVHLDDCHRENGPLRVLPGSHRHGWVEDDLQRWKTDVEEVCCVAPAGGVVVMRPLLLHASSSSQTPGHRRVLHIEYAAGTLPGGLQWHTQVADGCTASGL